jgi:hypothetical protein
MPRTPWTPGLVQPSFGVTSLQSRSRLLLLAALTVAGIATCDSGPSGPGGSGTIVVTVTSPNGAEGAALLELSGGVGLGPVTSAGGDVFFDHRETTSRVVVILDAPGEIRFDVRSDDVGTPPQVTLLQVADGDDALRPSLFGYHVDLVGIMDASLVGLWRAP